MNRRISLVVLNDKTERQIRGLPEEPIEEIQNEADAAQALGLGEAPGGCAGRKEPGPGRAGLAAGRRRPAGERLAQPTPVAIRLRAAPQQQRRTPSHLRRCSSR